MLHIVYHVNWQDMIATIFSIELLQAQGGRSREVYEHNINDYDYRRNTTLVS